MVWPLALCPDDTKQDSVVYGAEFGVVFLAKGPRTASIQEGLDCLDLLTSFLKKDQSAPRPSEHPPVMGEKMSKRLGGIKGCKYKTSSWHLNRFPDAVALTANVPT